tara:strand:+ start:240 stop:473 length:234 start_codon:yes stop_codon:yes gene_type:complete
LVVVVVALETIHILLQLQVVLEEVLDTMVLADMEQLVKEMLEVRVPVLLVLTLLLVEEVLVVLDLVRLQVQLVVMED